MSIDPGMWDDPEYCELSLETKVVWHYLLTGPEAKSGVPGLVQLSVGALADGVRIGYPEVESALEQLERIGWCEVDRPHRLIRVPNAVRRNKPGNPNVVTGWARRWLKLPKSPLKYKHLASIEECISAKSAKQQEAWENDWQECREEAQRFESALQRASNTLSEGLSKESPKPVPHPATDDDTLRAGADDESAFESPFERDEAVAVAETETGSETGSGAKSDGGGFPKPVESPSPPGGNSPRTEPSRASAATRLWRLQQELREGLPGAPPINTDEPTPAELAPILAALKNYDAAVLEHVLRVDAATATAPDAKDKDIMFFNGRSNWTSGHIDFTKERCIPQGSRGGYEHVAGRKKFAGGMVIG